MNEISFYKFLKNYAIPENWQVIKAKNKDYEYITPHSQEKKIKEEQLEYFATNRKSSIIALFFIYFLTDDLFVAFYEEYIKDTKMSELADVVLSKCTYMALIASYMENKDIPIWYIANHIENLHINVLKRGIKLHIKAKIKYNNLRKDW